MSTSKKVEMTFQPSLIWDGHNRVDPAMKPVTVKAKVSKKADAETNARRKLPKLSVGRNWVRID